MSKRKAGGGFQDEILNEQENINESNENAENISEDKNNETPTSDVHPYAASLEVYYSSYSGNYSFESSVYVSVSGRGATLNQYGSYTFSNLTSTSVTVSLSADGPWNYWISCNGRQGLNSLSVSVSVGSSGTTSLSFSVEHCCVVTYYPNGASGSARVERLSEQTYTIGSCPFYRSGYEFMGWSTSSSGSVYYEPGDSIWLEQDLDLYAVWEQTSYYVYLDVYFARNYGTYAVSLRVSGSGLSTRTISEGGTASFSYLTDGSASSITVTVAETSPSPNYFYVGTSSNPTSLTSYSFSWSRNSDRSVTIYTEQRYAITYNGNGATSGSTSTTYYAYRDSSWPTIASNGFSRTGYAFAGWAISSTGSAMYQPGDSYTSNGYPTLYAVWNRITYTITYNGNGNTGGSTSPTTKYYGTSVTLRANGFTRTGYHFVGWATSSTGAVVYDDQDTYTINASDTLYAKWAVNNYYVSFQPNGASGSAYTQTFTWGVSTTLTANRFTRSGYKFLGWSVGSSTAGVSYGDMATVSNLTSSNGGMVYFYAQWEATVQAKYDSAGGYWYVENGKIPQTKVTDSTLINALNSVTTTGSTYYIAGQTLQARVYSGTEYCEWNETWYEVEPIKWRLTSDTNQAVGYNSTSPISAVLAEIVYVDQYSSIELNVGAGYSTEAVNEFLHNAISTQYLDSYSYVVENFSDGTTFINTTTTNEQVLVASTNEIESVAKTTAVEFSDLVEDMIKYYGGTNVYFTRDLGSNYNNIVCFNEVGREVQRFATDYRGVQFTVRFTEYGCVA